MAKSVVSESALRELLREALSNTDAMGHDAPEPAITPNPAMDRTSLELDLDPIEVRHAPRSKNELIVMVRNLLDTVDDEQSGELYKKIKSLVGGDESGVKDFGKARELPPPTDATDVRSTDMADKKNNVGESMNLADAVRSIVAEAMPPKENDLAESIRAIAAEAIEEAKKKAKKGNPFAFGGGKFKANQFKKKGKAKNEADGAMPDKGAKKTKTSDFGGGSLAEAVRAIAAEALQEAKPAFLNDKDKSETDEMDELDEANYDAAVAEADGEHKLPFGFGKGKFMGHGGFDTSRPEDDDLEGPPSKTFAAMGGSASDDFRADGTLAFDPNEDIIDDEEKQAYLDSLSKNADWDPEESDDDDAAPADVKGKKGTPKPRIDAGTGYGVDGDTYEKIGEKLGFTPEGAKKAVITAQERFKVLHNMDPDDLAELVMTGVDDYIQMLTKTGELDAGDIKYLHDNADVVADSESFREFFSKYVKRAVRDERADTQDDSDD